MVMVTSGCSTYKKTIVSDPVKQKLCEMQIYSQRLPCYKDAIPIRGKTLYEIAGRWAFICNHCPGQWPMTTLRDPGAKAASYALYTNYSNPRAMMRSVSSMSKNPKEDELEVQVCVCWCVCGIISLNQKGCSKGCVGPEAEWTMFQERRTVEWNTDLDIITSMRVFFLLVSE